MEPKKKKDVHCVINASYLSLIARYHEPYYIEVDLEDNNLKVSYRFWLPQTWSEAF